MHAHQRGAEEGERAQPQVGVGPRHGLLRLQATAGNAAVARLVSAGSRAPVQRMLDEPTTANARDTTEEDRQALRGYRAEVADPHVQGLLDELLVHLDRVRFQRSAGGTSGGNTRPVGSGYLVDRTEPAAPADRIALLVHELTHVAVNEAYGSDMLNLNVAPLDADERAAVRDETPDREEDRQNARLAKKPIAERRAFMDHVVNATQELLAAVPAAGFTADRAAAVRDKLTAHTMAKPYHEYDAVLAHLLTWCERDTIDTGTVFYRRLTELVAETRQWRAAGAVTPAAPPPPPPPAGRRRLRDRAMAALRRMGRIFARRGAA